MHECFPRALLVGEGITALSPVSLSENNDEHNEIGEKRLENKTKYSFQHCDHRAQAGIKKLIQAFVLTSF